MKTFIGVLFAATFSLWTAGCALFLPGGKVPESLVNAPGTHTETPQDQDEILMTSLRMYFSTHGFIKTKPVLRLSAVPPSFCRKLREEGIIFSGQDVSCHYILEYSKGEMILKSPNGKPLLRKRYTGKK